MRKSYHCQNCGVHMDVGCNYCDECWNHIPGLGQPEMEDEEGNTAIECPECGRAEHSCHCGWWANYERENDPF